MLQLKGRISLDDVLKVAVQGESVSVDKACMEDVMRCHLFLKDF